MSHVLMCHDVLRYFTVLTTVAPVHLATLLSGVWNPVIMPANLVNWHPMHQLSLSLARVTNLVVVV